MILIIPVNPPLPNLVDYTLSVWSIGKKKNQKKKKIKNNKKLVNQIHATQTQQQQQQQQACISWLDEIN